MAELTRAGQTRLQANRSRVYGPVTVPDAGYTRMRVSIDVTNTDQLDPGAVLSWIIDASEDAGATWVVLAGATTYGAPTAQRQAMLLDPETARPWVQFPCPPAGARLRATVQTAGQAMDIGFIVEAW